MKTILITAMYVSFAYSAFGQSTTPDELLGQGFIHKAEAKNQIINDVKEGKWVEYVKNDTEVTTDTNAPFYRLTFYVSDKPYGIVRGYFKRGKLRVETPYMDGEKNGIEKVYYKSGKIWKEIPYQDGKLDENRIVKE
jgi:antitoxin component YwqK of YwqJK toxin-antitoxin module